MPPKTEDNLQNLTPGSIEEVPRDRRDTEEMRRETPRLKDQSLTEGDFRQFRLQRGIYGQKQKPDVQMVRVKIPWGRLTSAQLLALADIADLYPGEDRVGIAHVT